MPCHVGCHTQRFIYFAFTYSSHVPIACRMMTSFTILAVVLQRNESQYSVKIVQWKWWLSLTAWFVRALAFTMPTTSNLHLMRATLLLPCSNDRLALE